MKCTSLECTIAKTKVYTGVTQLYQDSGHHPNSAKVPFCLLPVGPYCTLTKSTTIHVSCVFSIMHQFSSWNCSLFIDFGFTNLFMSGDTGFLHVVEICVYVFKN